MENSTKIPHPLSVRQKILIVVVSLILLLVFVEIGLRCVGYLYLLSYQGKVESKFNFKILCLGDSFTFGVGASKAEESYPWQLERLLNENYKNKRLEVINLGVPGFNSSQTLKSLETNAIRFNPNLIIILTGLNNESQLLDTSYPLLFHKEKISRNILFQRLTISLNKFRVYKLLKICMLNLKNKIMPTYNKEITIKSLDLMYGEGEFRKLIEKHLNSLPVNRQQYAVPINEFKMLVQLNPSEFWPHYQLGWLYKMAGEDALAFKEFNKAAELNPNDFWTINQLGWLYTERGQAKLAREQFERVANIDHYRVASEEDQKEFGFSNSWRHFELGLFYKSEGRYEQAISEFKSAIEVEPYHFWKHLRPHNELAQIYKRLGRYKLAKGEFEAIIAINPGHLLAYLELEQIFEKKLNEKEKSKYELNIQNQLKNLLRYDLTKVVEFSKGNNIKVILLTYPHANNYIRTTIKEIAENFSIPIVDNFSLFAERIKKGETGIHFIPPYGHCNAVGYKIMAEEIYKTLINEGIVK
ncbi:MAG: tetratricopeptide repeat protein [Candidatus Omnitrophica bacterium]|nr:tetratricopeptide repeat protein [Candidatus Omnitrophota bacterium]